MRVRLRADFRDRVADGRLHQGVTPLEEYFVVEINQYQLRLINDEGEPILYPKDLFEVLDPTLPSGWQFSEYADGWYNLGPVRTSNAGFYEDLFCSDGDRIAQVGALQVLREELEAAMENGSEEDRRLIQRDMGRLSRSSISKVST